MNLNQVTLPVLDVATSVAFYRGMGFVQVVDSPHYARFECPAGDATFSLHAVDQLAADSSVVVYFECEKTSTSRSVRWKHGVMPSPRNPSTSVGSGARPGWRIRPATSCACITPVPIERTRRGACRPDAMTIAQGARG